MSLEIEVKDVRADYTQELPEYEPLRPIMDWVLVKPILEQKTEDGFYIPEEFRQQNKKGIVLSVGNFVVLGGQTFPLSDFVNPGDIIVWGDYTSEKVIIDGDVITAVRLQDIRQVSHKKEHKR